MNQDQPQKGSLKTRDCQIGSLVIEQERYLYHGQGETRDRSQHDEYHLWLEEVWIQVRRAEARF